MADTAWRAPKRASSRIRSVTAPFEMLTEDWNLHYHLHRLDAAVHRSATRLRELDTSATDARAVDDARARDAEAELRHAMYTQLLLYIKCVQPFQVAGFTQKICNRGEWAMEYSLLKAWDLRVPEPTRRQPSPALASSSSSTAREFLVLHPRDRPPSTASPVWKQSCRPRCSITATQPKQVDMETTMAATGPPMTLARKNVLRKPGSCKRFDSIKAIIEHDACASGTLYHSLRQVKPGGGNQVDEGPATSRAQLRHVREGASGDKKATLLLAERLMVCDKSVAMKQPAPAHPPWSKEYLQAYLTDGTPRVLFAKASGGSHGADHAHVGSGSDDEVDAWADDDDDDMRSCAASVRDEPHLRECNTAGGRMTVEDVARKGREKRSPIETAFVFSRPLQVSRPPVASTVKCKVQFQDQVRAWKASLGSSNTESDGVVATLLKTQDVRCVVQRSHARAIEGKHVPCMKPRVSPITWRFGDVRRPRTCPVALMKATS
ncbi:Aste57867_23289 [Aphanomyces stellatus]|uniref:Aste57867_23289 protein n=1 Tax=Aphanomyces stellatus TaxID=120398 RepID=A0A485LRY5_9STRA|nr:hypothetical protein As57867_023218 [Aphanomyces stellatus]VFT99934.1 Aste57867_23289 [Aphanomyces stellatus]